MKYIILDLEATCWENRNVKPNEIIEIGALCIDENQKILGEFSSFIKPKTHPILSDFCIELTTITQSQVDNAPYFPVVLQEFQDWISTFDDEYFLCSWGFYDKGQFEKDCKLWNLPIHWLKNHISIKHQHAQINNLQKGIGMAQALERENIPLTGTHHRGIDDARNISMIFLKYFDFWKF
jgi:3'-5' exoribonuclease 1